mmetsp:Transcript_27028/g.86902  ORF Transcript_27028/g.86902 Transcript_27028/m.86902 type:complete len:214 (+) Transcript_27028:261-902(+)
MWCSTLWRAAAGLSSGTSSQRRARDLRTAALWMEVPCTTEWVPRLEAAGLWGGAASRATVRMLRVDQEARSRLGLDTTQPKPASSSTTSLLRAVHVVSRVDFSSPTFPTTVPSPFALPMWTRGRSAPAAAALRTWRCCAHIHALKWPLRPSSWSMFDCRTPPRKSAEAHWCSCRLSLAWKPLGRWHPQASCSCACFPQSTRRSTFPLGCASVT